MIDLSKYLRCPHCGAPMRVTENQKSAVCDGAAKKHCFDFSSSGYLNFSTPSQSASGDSKEAVRSRTAFLESDSYLGISESITDSVLKHCNGGLVIDAGCGEGYYTNNIAQKYNGDVIGFDLSKYGVEHAAKAARKKAISNSFFAVGSVFELPVGGECADAVVNIFAPCVEKEYARVMKKGGVLITAGAGEDHLLGLKKAIYDTTYKNTERDDMPKDLKLLEEKRVSYLLKLDNNELISSLFSMTPYFYRTGESGFKRLAELDSLETEIDVVIKIFRKEE
ncbi:MAG: methyltransferase domain-containing protein [Clostridia bacterium]|nr:methyltransferase domain-containing protein [Clostridia bacterium]